jgi:hypothetical protein
MLDANKEFTQKGPDNIQAGIGTMHPKGNQKDHNRQKRQKELMVN